MEKPAGNDEIRLVALLRTLKKSQDEVADVLKMGKEKVGKIESWLRNEPYESLEGIFSVHLLQKAVDEELSEKKILPVELARAARLSEESILDHYNKRPPGKPAGSDNIKLSEQHQLDLLEFANELVSHLDPHLESLPLRTLGGPGGHSASARSRSLSNNYSLLWRVDKGNMVSLIYGPELSTKDISGIIFRYFKQHVLSSPYSWLLGDNGKGLDRWKSFGGEELKCRTRLLRQIDRDVINLTGKPLSDPDLMNVGLSTWFSESIWSAALDGLYRTLGYSVGSIPGGLFKANYGGSFLGLAETRKGAEQYLDWHKKLMARYAISKAVKALIQLAKEREAVTESMREVLARWAVDRHIPGKCDYKFCRG